MLREQTPAVIQQNRCINCSLLISKYQRKHSIEQVSTPIINLLKRWIISTQLTSECLLCTEYLTVLQDRVTTIVGRSLPLPAYGHKRECFSCGKSILCATRTYPVQYDQPQKNILVRHVLQHLVSRLERVCAACWRSATREVQRHEQHDSNRLDLSEDAGSSDT